MPATQTSKNAYIETTSIQERQREAILRQIGFDGCNGSCIADISYITGIDKSSVSARFNELKKDGKIEMVNKRPSKTTRITAEHWRLVFNETLF